MKKGTDSHSGVGRTELFTHKMIDSIQSCDLTVLVSCRFCILVDLREKVETLSVCIGLKPVSWTTTIYYLILYIGSERSI